MINTGTMFLKSCDIKDTGFHATKTATNVFTEHTGSTKETIIN